MLCAAAFGCFQSLQRQLELNEVCLHIAADAIDFGPIGGRVKFKILDFEIRS